MLLTAISIEEYVTRVVLSVGRVSIYHSHSEVSIYDDDIYCTRAHVLEIFVDITKCQE